MINVPRATQFMEHVGQWIGYIAAFVTLVHLPLQISRWRAVLRLYGRIPWSLVRQIGVYSLRNKMLRLQLGSLSVMLLIFVVPITVNFVGADILGMLHPFGAVARSQELPALLVFAWQLERVIGYLVPPAGLLLGTAKSVNVHLVAVLNRKARPFRVVSLLDLKGNILPTLAGTFMYNNLRTISGHEWRTVVHHLMDVVPLIIVDTAVRTEYVDAEMHRIERFGYEYKVISYSTLAFGNEVDALESGIGAVVDAAERLGEEVAPEILKRLKQPTDVARRWRAQQNYNAMIKSVPRPVRFNPDINAMLMKAHFILAWALDNFLRECKQTRLVGHSNSILEDISSRVSPEEEDAFLRQSRGLDEVRGISFSALDLALQTSGPQQAFNIASAHNKIGKCARFSREWESALDHLGIAIEMFGRMSDSAIVGPKNLQDIQKELADAHFLRGEVHMVRYRQTGANSERENAASDFRASMSLDDVLGQDSSETASRLRSLSTGT